MRYAGLAGVLTFVAVFLSCGDPFSVQDVLGEWQTTSVNGTDIPGTVDVYVDGDTVRSTVTQEHWTFAAGGVCQESSVVNGASDTIEECEYQVDEEAEEITITLLSVITLSGPVEGSRITLGYRVNPGSPLNTIVLVPRPPIEAQ
jgi:hypothetical protein